MIAKEVLKSIKQYARNEHRRKFLHCQEEDFRNALQLCFRKECGLHLNLDEPKRFREKIQGF